MDLLYAHLDPKTIPTNIPQLRPSPDGSGGVEFPEEAPIGHKPKGLSIQASSYIGKAGTTGDTHNIIQLHLELQLRGPETEGIGLGKRDILGIYNYIKIGEGEDAVYPYPKIDEPWNSYPTWFRLDKKGFAYFAHSKKLKSSLNK